MKGNRGKNTGPEKRFRKALRNRGLIGYRVNVRKLLGTPDVVWIGKRVAVFIHGCFWHGCSACAAKKNLQPSTRADYWREKVETNRARDARNRSLLENEGWTVLVFWEHDVRDNLEAIVTETQSTLSQKKSKSLGSR